MGLPMGQKLVKSGSTWARLSGTHISETAIWIYAILSSTELSRPVAVQNHGHLTLPLDFRGKIVQMLYLRNGRADRHGTKEMWVDKMLDPQSSKLAGSPKSEASEIMLRTSETILALVRSD